MKNHNMTKTLTTLLLALGLFTLCPIAGAVNPPPDGGYPGGNTAEGTNALLSRTTGIYNTAVGIYSVLSLTDGNFCTGVGAGTLLVNTADENAGSENTAVGRDALFANTSGEDNTAIGSSALGNNPPGNSNTAVGSNALLNTTGGQNTGIGADALFNNTTGNSNTAIGYRALHSSTGSGNIALGQNAGGSVTTASNVICIGASGANVDGGCYIGNAYFNVQPIVGTDPDSVTITSTGRLGRGNVSSRRYKHDIKSMEKASEVLFGLKPVSFRYNKAYDTTQTIAFGLIAEEVAEVAPDLVGRNPEGQPESVRYEQINAMLLNEFLKEHRKVEELKKNFESKLAEQQQQIKALTSTLEKVSAQIEFSRRATKLADND